MISRWMWRSKVAMLTLVVGLAVGCSSDPEGGTDPDNQNQFDHDVEDVGVDETGVDDVGPAEDTGPDADPDAGLDADVDAGDVEHDVDDDTDVDDGPVDGEGDNCPEISNPDQADRSRDGIGDACDNFPYYHDPSNPESVDVIYEEDGEPNDGFWDAYLDWNLDLPVVVEGGIDPAGDIDYYSITVDEPTTILVHVDQLTSSSDLWPVVIVMDGIFENFAFSSVIFADNQGESVVQDLHLPVAGEYHFIISDYNNLVEGGGGTGGADYGYRFYISTPPLPPSQHLTVPTPRQIEPYDDRVAATYTVDVSDGDTLKVEATGAPRNQLSLLFPSIQFLDADTGDVLAYTLEDHVETDSMRNELTLKVGDVDEVLVVVESHSAIGDNDVVIDVDVFDKPEHLEPPLEPRHEREDYLLWLRPGSFIESMIGPPIAVADDALGPDEDYFMMMTNPGDFFQLSVEPVQEGLLVPEVTIGRFTGAGSYWTWHEGAGAFDPGQSDSLSALVTTDDHRDSIIQVVHANNHNNILPVGGPDYAYELHVESLDWEQEAEEYDEFPVTIPVVLEAGEQGVYDVDFKAGYDYSIDYNGNFSRRLHLVDTNTWESVDDTTGSMGYFARPDEDVILAVRDDNGNPITDTAGIAVEITEGQGPEDINVPAVVDSQLDDNTSLEVYRADLSEGELLEVRTASSTGPAPEVELIGDSIESVENDAATMALARAEADSEVIIVVERATSADVEYSMGVHTVAPADVAAPHEDTGSFDDDMRGEWWQLELEEGGVYAINAAGESELATPHWVAAFDAETLEPIAESDDGFSVFDADSTDSQEVYVTVADADGPIDGSTDFAVSIASVDEQPYDGPEFVEFVDGVRPVFVELDHADAGLSTVEVVSDNDDGAVVRSDIIDPASLDVVATDTAEQPLAAVARSEAREFTAVIVPDATDGQSWEAEVEITHTSIDVAQSLDPDEATTSDPLVVDEWPAAYRGDLADIDVYRVFESELEDEDRLWVISMPGEGTSGTDAAPNMYLVAPDGFDYDWDFGSGEGNFPALEAVELDDDGIWTVEFGAGASDAFDSEEFVMYFLRR